MPDKNHKAIVDALDVLARGVSIKTNGKITGVNLAKEAGVSKATLYRYFKEFPNLNDEYVTLRRKGVCLNDHPAESLQDAYRLLVQEVKDLRLNLAQQKKEAAMDHKLKLHQIQLLWMENERLKGEVKRLLPRESDIIR